MKRYNIINDSLGWLCFLIAAITYLLTIEPTASFWDCPEFISQGAKLEVGHPPGNPIFMLAARFFVTLFGGISNAAIAVNAMSALLSAATILLLFWTITHLAKRLVVRDGSVPSVIQTAVIMGAGLCGSLAYTWSDTFWFSAVEGEVYAFSSFCTALVFWLILKWENRYTEPHSDRYLILIAFIIGVSIAVHLLNLLCIPAICLVFYYRKFKTINVKGSLAALGVSCAIIALILFGLVPGFMKVAQKFELFFVNTVGMSYNMGVLIYALILVGVSVWTIRELYVQRNPLAIKAGFFLTILLSGIPFIGHGALIPALLLIGLVVYLAFFCKRIPVRVFNVIILSVFVIFIGYSSYALLLIRASANTPMNQNSPNNVFALATYMSREQYGETPLLKGPTFAEELVTAVDPTSQETFVAVDESGMPRIKIVSPYLRTYDGSVIDHGGFRYAPIVKHSPDEPDKYVEEVRAIDYATSSSLDMFFTRIFSSKDSDVKGYKSWSEYSPEYFLPIPEEKRLEWKEYGYVPYVEVAPYLVNLTPMNTRVDAAGNETEPNMVWKPGFWTNLKYFINYQLNHMYWRYFMWNFAGRQNDEPGNGEPHLGNWISGIPFIDNPRLGDQSMLPDQFGKANKGHNVFYMLPLLLGVIGLLWQALARTANGNRGIEQFWVVFFLFFMTGIAIVLYLNQIPGQPRERDYAFAGSFYAFAIWIGLGVPAIAALISSLIKPKAATAGADDSATSPVSNSSWVPACVAIVIGLIVPLQMVSQTWDDHDRSGRYTTRDLGLNYLRSLDENAVIFTFGDNDTFPLWYAQEVEGERTDVRVINLSYLTTDWYANQMKHPTYEADAVEMYAQPTDYGYEKLGWNYIHPSAADSLVDAEVALKDFYGRVDTNDKTSPDDFNRMLMAYNLVIPVDVEAAAARYHTSAYPDTADRQAPYPDDMYISVGRPGTGFSQADLLSLDIITNSMKNGQKRPVYFAVTVPNSNYEMFENYLHYTGMALEVAPYDTYTVGLTADKSYRRIMEDFRWGGVENPDSNLYLDETVRRMTSSTRSAILKTVSDLLATGDQPASEWAVENARAKGEDVPVNRFDMARQLLKLVETKLPSKSAPFDPTVVLDMANYYYDLYAATGNKADLEASKAIIDTELPRFAQFVRYAASLPPYLLGHLTGLDNYNLYAFSGLLGLQNKIALREAMDKVPDSEEKPYYIELLDNVQPEWVTFYISRWLYIQNYSENDLAHIAERATPELRNMAIAAIGLKKIHDLTGITNAQITDSIYQSMSINPAEAQRVYDIRVR